MFAVRALVLLLAVPATVPDSPSGWPLDLRKGCPAGTDAITVCGRKTNPERYRLPHDPQREIDHPVEHGWGDLARDMDDISHSGLPGTNSAVGSGGQTGQRAGMVRDYKRWQDARSRAGDDR